MEEKSRKFLYKQLLEMDKFNKKENPEPLMQESDFMALSDKEALKYMFDYRDNQTLFDDGNGENRYYIELPDMDFEGQDLSDVRIKYFVLQTLQEDETYRVSSVNLKNTNATIDLFLMIKNRTEFDEDGKVFNMIDFSKSNFEGCNIFGILPDEYDDKSYMGLPLITIGKENLDSRYLERRRIFHQTTAKKEIADRAYERLMNNDTLKGMKGINQTSNIDLMDYDFGEKSEEELAQILANIRSIESYKGNSFRVLFPTEAHQEKIYAIIEKSITTDIPPRIIEWMVLRQYQLGNLEFVKKFYKDINKGKLSEIVEEELDKGNLKFVEFFSGYIVLRDKNKLEDLKNKTNMQVARKKGDDGTFEQCFLSLSFKEQQSVIKTEYKNGNLRFVEEYLNMAEESVRNEIVLSEYDKRNMRFVLLQMDFLEFEIKDYIISNEYKNNNMKLVEQCLPKASMELKEDIILSEIDKQNWDLVARYYVQFNKKTQEKILEKAWNSDGKAFVKTNFKDGSKKLKAKILKELYEAGDLKFVEAHFYSGSESFRNNVIIAEYEKGNKKFVELHYNGQIEKTKLTIAQMAYKKGDFEFLEKNFQAIPDSVRDEYLEKLYNSGHISKVGELFYGASTELKKKMAADAFEKNDNRLLNRYFSEASVKEKIRLMLEEEKKGNYDFVDLQMSVVKGINNQIYLPPWLITMMQEGKLSQRMIKKIVETEKSIRVMHGKKEVSTNRMLLSIFN